MNECCNKCCVDKCINLNFRDIIYSINEQITILSSCKINDLKYGYKCKDHTDFKINKLSLQKWVLENYKKFSKCICLTDINIIKEDIQTTINCKPSYYKDLIIDKSNYDNWNKLNPYAVSRESWEKYVYQVCGELSLEISVETACNFIYDIQVQNISCDLVSALSVYSKECEIQFSKDVYTKPECKIAFQELISKSPNCNLDFKTYIKLINTCNLRPEIIKEVYACDLKLELTNNKPCLITNKNSYCLDDIKFTKTLCDDSCNIITEVPKIEKFIREYKKR